MIDTKEQVLSFLEKCEEIKKCKFIMATTRIKDLLKCIVNCPDIYSLFDEVTKEFNYPSVKNKCLVSVSDGMFSRSKVVLPNTIGQRLAFIFCLLVEIDRGSVNLSEFLMTYYPEDGSYYVSYRAFCNTIIKGLQEAVSQAFEEELKVNERETLQIPDAANSLKSELLSVLGISIAEERQYIESSSIPEEDKEGGINILNQLFVAVRTEDIKMIEALICGYNYFVLYHKCVSEGIAPLIKTLAAYEQAL